MTLLAASDVTTVCNQYPFPTLWSENCSISLKFTERASMAQTESNQAVTNMTDKHAAE